MSEKISIIIPAYNSENTIIRCVDSIRKQTYKNLEIIVVNDGSTDNTSEIVNEISNVDSRVKLISIPNGGVSHARNIGIDNATGDYITFVDSDDTIDSEMYDSLLKLICKYGVQIAHCSYKNCNEKGEILSLVGNNGKEIVQSTDDAVECLLTGKYFAGGAWNKLYLAKIIGCTRFDENIKINEDVLFNFEVFSKAEKSVYTDTPFYNYFAVASSATHSMKSALGNEQGLYVAKKIEQLSQNRKYHDIALYSVALSYLNLWRVYTTLFEKDKGKKQTVKNKVMQYKKDGIYSKRNEKIIIALLRYCPIAYILFYKLYDKVRVKKLDPEQ